jgi:hypothetical protein
MIFLAPQLIAQQRTAMIHLAHRRLHAAVGHARRGPRQDDYPLRAERAPRASQAGASGHFTVRRTGLVRGGQSSAMIITLPAMQHPARGNRWATGAERVKGGGNMLELRVPIGLLSSFLTSLKGEGFPRQPRPSTGQCETQDTIPFLSRLLLVRAVHLR